MISRQVLFEEDEEIKVDQDSSTTEAEIMTSDSLLSSTKGRIVIMATRFLRTKGISISGIQRISKLRGVTLRPILSNKSLARDISAAKKVAAAVNDIVDEIQNKLGGERDEDTRFFLYILVTKFLTDTI